LLVDVLLGMPPWTLSPDMTGATALPTYRPPVPRLLFEALYIKPFYFYIGAYYNVFESSSILLLYSHLID
jgi:hypothetical protein